MVALLAGLSVGCMHVRPASAFQKASSMEQYERAMWDAVKDQKWLEVQTHMAESYLATTPEGVCDRAAMIAQYQRLQVTGYEISDLQSRPNGNDMVVTYHLRLHGTLAGRPLPEQAWLILTVWQTVKRGWIQIAWSASRVQAQP